MGSGRCGGSILTVFAPDGTETVGFAAKEDIQRTHVSPAGESGTGPSLRKHIEPVDESDDVVQAGISPQKAQQQPRLWTPIDRGRPNGLRRESSDDTRDAPRTNRGRRVPGELNQPQSQAPARPGLSIAPPHRHE